MKRIVLIMFASAICCMFTSCSTPNAKEDYTLTSIYLTISNGFGPLNTNYDVIIEDKQTIKTLENIINKANREPGVVNIMDPEYEIKLNYKNKDAVVLYLWLGEENLRSVLMYVKDSHTIYTVPSNMTKQLTDLFQKPSINLPIL